MVELFRKVVIVVIEYLLEKLQFGFIVEGFNDELTVMKAVPNAKFVVTNGTRYNNRVRMDIDALQESCDSIFILTDPDKEGDRIHNCIIKEYDFDRIHIDELKAKCLRNNKWKTGVEHCDVDYLRDVIYKSIIEKHL